MARGVVKPRHGSRLRGRQEGGRHCSERFAVGAHVGVLEDTSVEVRVRSRVCQFA